jgi:hypothetical protein
MDVLPLRDVEEARLVGGASILSNFKFHWWSLRLSCGHTVERRIRWTPTEHPDRGWAAQHHGVSLDRLPAAPKRARCEECGPVPR